MSLEYKTIEVQKENLDTAINEYATSGWQLFELYSLSGGKYMVLMVRNREIYG
jgi:hypothetical protein